MSVALVKHAMKRFLADPTPEVLCVEGRWGTGKTYTWEEAVRTALAEGQLALKNYAYISLFGLKDSSDILQAIYANTTNLSSNGYGRKLPEKLGGLTVDEIKKKLKAFGAFAAEHASVPHVAGLGGVARALLANFVKETLVCIDDFERKSKEVSVNEIMGTIAQLRDVRRCKVVLILNENSLSEPERVEFQRFSEKVVDKSFRFLPTSTESASIVFSETGDLTRELRQACEELGIVNVRVMAKIDRYAHDLMKLLEDVDATVMRNVMRSLVVIIWSMLSPEGEGSPSLQYLVQKRERQFFGVEKIETTADEDRWGVLLSQYGFTHCDEFDQLMIEDVKNGFFNYDKLKTGIETYLVDAARTRARAALEAAWQPFHASFDDNVDEVANSIFDGYVDNIMYLAPTNLSSAVTVLKDIGHTEQAMELLGQFMVAREGEDIFDRRQEPFGSEIRDPDVCKAFDEKVKRKKPDFPSPIEAARQIYKGSWSSKDEESLARFSIEEFVKLFRSETGPDRSILIFGCLEFRKIGNATPRQRAIAQKAEAALVRIGRENSLNAHRLRKYNVDILAQGADRESDDA